MTYPSMGFRAAPFVPGSGPEPPSGRAQINALLRRQRAARVRPYNRVAAAEILNPNTQLADQWRAAQLARERDEAVARVRRQVAAQREAEDFAERRGAAKLAAERARFMEAHAAARALLAGGPGDARARSRGGSERARGSGSEGIRFR